MKLLVKCCIIDLNQYYWTHITNVKTIDGKVEQECKSTSKNVLLKERDWHTHGDKYHKRNPQLACRIPDCSASPMLHHRLISADFREKKVEPLILFHFLPALSALLPRVNHKVKCSRYTSRHNRSLVQCF